MTTFATPQPNVPGRGIIAAYSLRFWGLVVGIGLAAGLVGAAFIALLNGVEHLAWRRPASDFLAALKAASPARHVLVLLIAGLIAGGGAVALRRLRGSGGGEISDAIWSKGARLDLVPSLARGTLSIITVAMGASLGREAAPQLAGAAFASEACDRMPQISAEQRRLLVACGAGAGMAAVYNVPLGGALFALEVLLGSLELPLVIPALLMSTVATAVGWIVVPDRATYHLPVYGVSAALMCWAVLVGPLAGAAAIAWVRLITSANRLRPRRRGRVLAPIVVFTALGALSIAYPQLLGNGKEVSQLAFLGHLSFGLFAVLFVLKPLVTSACLGSGSPGGLFTPTLAFGVLFGGLLGHVWGGLWPGTPTGSYALIGGGAVLAASMQGPLSASLLVIELTRSPGTLTVPLLLAAGGATIIARRYGAPSIYSARIALADEPDAAAARGVEFSGVSEQGAATVPDGRYVVDPASSKAGFKAHGGWGLFRVPGHFQEFGGEVNVTDGQFTASGKASSASISTRLGLRDWHLRTGDYLHAKAHPEVGLEVTQGSLADGRASAQVSVRGTTVPSELQVEVLEAGGDRLRLKARGDLARKAFGMRPPAFGVGPVIELDLEITAVRSGNRLAGGVAIAPQAARMTSART